MSTAPIHGNVKLLSTAREKSYKANTFHARTPYNSWAYRAVIQDHARERRWIRHLVLKINLENNQRAKVPERASLSGMPEVLAIPQLSTLCSNLQSLTVLWKHDTEPGTQTHHSLPIKEDDDANTPVVAWETQGKIINLIQGLQDYKWQPSLRSLTLEFEQIPPQGLGQSEFFPESLDDFCNG